jgi:hypothetical protein
MNGRVLVSRVLQRSEFWIDIAAGVWSRHGISSVVIAVDLLVKGLRVERAGSAGGTGDQQQSNKSGHDGLHDYLSCELTLAAAGAGVSVLFHGLVRAAVTGGTTLTKSAQNKPAPLAAVGG